MKNFRFKSVISWVFALLFLLNIYVIFAGLFPTNHLVIVCGILLSSLQLYILDQFQRKNGVLKNLPYRVVINDLLAFMPLNRRRLISAQNNSGGALNRMQCEILARRTKEERTKVAQDNLSNPDAPCIAYLETNNSLLNLESENFRVVVGSGQCDQPYSLSILNFGRLNEKQLSKKNIHALSQGANMANCAVNTGDSGLSPHLIRGGADLIWHLNYNDCSLRNDDRSLNETMIRTIALKPYIKMIEVNFQAKELPATKNGLTAFAIVSFVKKLRALSQGKPIGIRLLHPGTDILNFLGKAMTATGVNFDFITIENLVPGMRALPNAVTGQQSFFDTIVSARKMVEQFRLPTKIIAAGLIVTEYELLRAIAFGADACFNASHTLVAKTLIDRLKMNRDAQSIRIAHFHRNTLSAVRSLMRLCRYERLTDFNRADFLRLIEGLETKTLKELIDQTEPVVAGPLYVNLN